MQAVLCVLRKAMMVCLYLSFLLLPLFFANNVYNSFKIENEIKVQEEKEVKKSIFQRTYRLNNLCMSNEVEEVKESSEEENSWSCFFMDGAEIATKGGMALLLAGLLSFKKVFKTGVI
jgi:hypothetical protein